MPNGINENIDDAVKVCKVLDIDYVVINIFDAVHNIKHRVKTALNDKWSMQSSINLPPRIRMSVLYAVSQTMNGRVANTCNLSEDWVGYSTRYGDSVGDFSPLSNLTVTEVKAVGREIGLPDHLIDKVPADDCVEKLMKRI